MPASTFDEYSPEDAKRDSDEAWSAAVQDAQRRLDAGERVPECHSCCTRISGCPTPAECLARELFGPRDD